MRFALIILIGLGLLAALAATILVQALTSKPALTTVTSAAPVEVDVLVAARPLTAMTVVDSGAVATRKVPQSDVPDGALSNPVQVVGKVLTVPVVEGEAFNQGSFARDGSGVHLAAALPAGKRAVSISLMDYTGMVGLLYPGSVVDVMISVQAAGGGRGETITRTLLQGVQVLAIGTEAVTADETTKTEEDSMIRRSRGDQRMVTLLVEPKQAQALQLAMQRGTLSLSLRNPLDQERVQPEPTRLADLAGGVLEETTPAMAAMAEAFMRNIAAARADRQQRQADPFNDAPQADRSQPEQPPQEADPLWEILIVRGTTAETQSFARPRASADGEAEPASMSREGVDGAGSPRLAADPIDYGTN